ncbi:MAG: ribbon-helix-helix protein, CopG family [Spirochaetaceae bacterium]
MARVRLSVDIEPEIKHQIAVLAALRGVSMSDLVVEAVRRVLAEEGTEELVENSSNVAGALRHYADADRRVREDSAWAEHVADDVH